jgi:DNA-binding NtrC family response regulator
MDKKVPKARILIIDDEKYWISFATDDLSMYKVVVAHNRQQALAEIELAEINKVPFDLVIASSSYKDILSRITPTYPVFVSTMRPSEEEARDALQLGAWRYIEKSFGESDLKRQVKEVVPVPEPNN